MKKLPQEKVHDKFTQVRLELNDALIERDEEIDLVLTALLCEEHCLFVGPPGTAKSLLLDSVVSWMGNDHEKFSILLTKFTVPEEVFGPISVQSLKNDVYKRITTGKLPEAHMAFIDEVWKGSSAILNTMLKILNERTYENAGTISQCPLQLCVAASNEWPQSDDGGRELGALFDRFLFRKAVKPIRTKEGRDKLLWNGSHVPTLGDTISKQDLQSAREDVADVDFTDEAKDCFNMILDALQAEGIQPGDRRKYKSIKAAKAHAFLCGTQYVQPEHLSILAHTLWDDPIEQPENCAQIIHKIADPTGAQIHEIMVQVEEIMRTSESTEAVPKLKELQKKLNADAKFGKHPKGIRAMEVVSTAVKIQYDRVLGRE